MSADAAIEQVDVCPGPDCGHVRCLPSSLRDDFDIDFDVDDPSLESFELTDAGNAERLIAAHGKDLIHVHELGAWFVWRDGLWRRDTNGQVLRFQREVARATLHAAIDLPDGKDRVEAENFARRSESERLLRAAVSLAAVDNDVIVPVDRLDRDPMLLACANGTLDLLTGALREHSRHDLLTRGTRVPFDPDAKAPRWERFLAEVFRGDVDTIEFVQRFVGYCLTGDTREHVFVVFYGSGCNGKSTLVETLRRVVGDHAATTPFDALTRSTRDKGPRDDLARLRGVRLVTAAESAEGSRLDEAVVKQITGGDTIAARPLYGRYSEFAPVFKLLLATNHRPQVDGGDDAIWRRVRLVPFTESFEGREDRDLSALLEAELPGILAWAVRGCLAWQREGLGTAPAIADATGAYRTAEDTLGLFLTDCTKAGGEVEAVVLRRAYEEWCADTGERPRSARALGRRLADRGISVDRRTNGARHYVGITLKSAVSAVSAPDSGTSLMRARKEKFQK